MQIKKARFLKSMKSVGDMPDTPMPHIAVCGKSNVGKSSLINLLTNNSKLAKTSATPGKTRLVNFFVINEEFMLVDLPGYGFAKASKDEQQSWPRMIEGYLEAARGSLRALLILLDIRHDPTQSDRLLFAWAAHFGLHVIIVCTKADKIAKTRRKQRLAEIKAAVSGGVDYPAVAASSLEKTGTGELLEQIEKALSP
jgi:ribosome biogenesis GTP-binding protein YsxC/EngB